jgi:hypothetical protein
MPKIYDGTTGVVTENGKPTLDFPGNNYKLNTPNLGLNMNSVSAFTVLRGPASSWDNVFGDLTGNFRFYNTSNGNTGFYYNTVLYGDVARSQTQKVVSMVAGSTLGGFRAWANNTPQFNLVTLASGSIDAFQIGTLASGSSFSDYLQELIFYSSDQSSNRTNIEDNINTFYNIYS